MRKGWRSARLAVVLGVALSATNVEAQSGGVVEQETVKESQRALLQAAIDSENGLIQREASGPIAERIRQAIGKPDARIMVTVKVIGSYSQEGCKKMAPGCC